MKKMLQKVFVVLSVFVLCTLPAFADLVSKDPVTGEVEFDPTAIVSPVENAIIATVLSIVGIIVIAIGLRWVIRLCRGRA